MPNFQVYDLKQKKLVDAELKDESNLQAVTKNVGLYVDGHKVGSMIYYYATDHLYILKVINEDKGRYKDVGTALFYYALAQSLFHRQGHIQLQPVNSEDFWAKLGFKFAAQKDLGMYLPPEKIEEYKKRQDLPLPNLDTHQDKVSAQKPIAREPLLQQKTTQYQKTLLQYPPVQKRKSFKEINAHINSIKESNIEPKSFDLTPSNESDIEPKSFDSTPSQEKDQAKESKGLSFEDHLKSLEEIGIKPKSFDEPENSTEPDKKNDSEILTEKKTGP